MFAAPQFAIRPVAISPRVLEELRRRASLTAESACEIGLGVRGTLRIAVNGTDGIPILTSLVDAEAADQELLDSLVAFAERQRRTLRLV